MAKVRINDVTVAPADGRLRAARLELPQPNTEADGFTLQVEGWVLGREEPVESLTVVHDGRPVVDGVAVDRLRPDAGEEVPDALGDERCGFSVSFGTLALPIAFEFELHAGTVAGRRFSIATISGRRDPVASDHSPKLQPLILNALGRSGTTWMVSLLASHPAVAAFQPTAHDARVGAYWMSVFQELSQPRSYLTAFAPQDLDSMRWWLGDGGVREPNSPALERWLAGRRPASVAAMCQEQMEAFYLANTTVDTSSPPAYFVEKFVPSQHAVDLLRELYPESRELILVRDFRDVLCSIIAFNRKRGFQAFGRDRVESDADYVATSLRLSALALLRRWLSHRHDAHLVRYEDLICAPADCLRGVLAHLGLTTDEATIETMLSTASGESSPGHRTTSDASASIGRWKHDLSPDLQALCERALGPVLNAFGYESGSPHAR